VAGDTGLPGQSPIESREGNHIRRMNPIVKCSSRHLLTELAILGCLYRTAKNGDHDLLDSVISRPHAMNVPRGVNFTCDDLIKGPLSAETVAALRAHPLLPNAVCAAAGALVAIARRPPVIINDLGRLVIGNLALYLHYSRDPTDPSSGLSAGRLKALCAEQKVCSRGRALAVMAMMRDAGDLVPATCQVDQRLRLLVPTEKLIKACRQYWEAIFLGTAAVIPRRSDAIAALQCEHVFAAFLQVFGGYFCAGMRLFKLEAGLTPFAQRNAALAILLGLLVASEQDGRAGSPGTVRISIAELARRFGVSRPQVVRVLDNAVEAALVERGAPDGLQVLPRLRSVTQDFYVTAFLLCDYYMQVALDHVGSGPAPLPTLPFLNPPPQAGEGRATVGRGRFRADG
jgi:MarR family